MPDLDLPPGDYRERKPRGWRWKLPWSHDDDVKLPLIMGLGGAGMVIALMLNLPAGTSPWIVGFAAGVSFCTGVMAGLVARR